jgi:ABC-2 type transport system permease protein
MTANCQVILTIFKRNFGSYFSSPTGYVFICAFVLTSGFAAFWPHEFFNANLANLDQLNSVFPLILLGFIPAITMSIWADERRQGTDELLLTLPATDLEVVAGKYLGAVAIFTVALLFSLSNIIVLSLLGDPDWGLAISTYFGYWMLGVAMLAIGMVASFLTDNLTVGFVLGVAFNVPLIFAYSADVIFADPVWTQAIRDWSLQSVLRDFSRGVISASSIVYLLSLTAAMSYLCMVLIGRRHWQGGEKQATSQAAHYTGRAVSLIVLAFALTLFFRTFDVRVDMSSEGLSSLSEDSKTLLAKLDGDTRIRIEAFVSPESKVPESYITTRIDLLTMLDELQKTSGGKISVTIHETEKHKAEAAIARQNYGIEPQTKLANVRGRERSEEFYMGVAIMSGLEKDVIPFFDRGLPAEYELVRSIVTLNDRRNAADHSSHDHAKPKEGEKESHDHAHRKTIGIVTTDYPAGTPGQGGGAWDYSQLQQTLEKQYVVKIIGPVDPIDKRHLDALLVVQPSSLDPAGLAKLLRGIRSGIPTAIFEDPRPFNPQIPGTNDPRQAAGGRGRFGMPSRPQPKGDVNQLWSLLGIDIDASRVIYQDYNPTQYQTFPQEFLFIGPGSGQEEAIRTDNDITSGLQQLLLLHAGGFDQQEKSKLTFTSLLKTSRQSGTNIDPRQWQNSVDAERTRRQTPGAHMLAAHITGKPTAAPVRTPLGHPAIKPPAKDADKNAPDINVVFVADSDVLASVFFQIRAQGEDTDFGRNFYVDVDNVSFVLNTMDVLSGDTRFLKLRKRRLAHRTLTAFEEKVNDAKIATNTLRKDLREDLKKEIKKYRDERSKIMQKIGEQPGITQSEAQRQFETNVARLGKITDNRINRMERENGEKVEEANNALMLEVRSLQATVKKLAVFIPPILPLAIGIGLFFRRRSRELEGAVQSRIRSS